MSYADEKKKVLLCMDYFMNERVNEGTTSLAMNKF